MVKDLYSKNYIYRYAVNPSEIKYYTNEYEPLNSRFVKRIYYSSWSKEVLYGKELNINSNTFQK